MLFSPRPLWLATLFALAVIIGVSSTGHACVCTNPVSIRDDYARSSVVFAGAVTHLEFRSDSWGDYVLATFQPTIVWKGDLAETVYVASLRLDCPVEFCDLEPDMCGELQEAWVIFGDVVPGLQVNGQTVVGTAGCVHASSWLTPEVLAQLPPPTQPVGVKPVGWGGLKMLYR
jgi:hypothetical protein